MIKAVRPWSFPFKHATKYFLSIILKVYNISVMTEIFSHPILTGPSKIWKNLFCNEKTESRYVRPLPPDKSVCSVAGREPRKTKARTKKDQPGPSGLKSRQSATRKMTRGRKKKSEPNCLAISSVPNSGSTTTTGVPVPSAPPNSPDEAQPEVNQPFHQILDDLLSPQNGADEPLLIDNFGIFLSTPGPPQTQLSMGNIIFRTHEEIWLKDRKHFLISIIDIRNQKGQSVVLNSMTRHGDYFEITTSDGSFHLSNSLTFVQELVDAHRLAAFSFECYIPLAVEVASNVSLAELERVNRFAWAWIGESEGWVRRPRSP